MDPSHSQYIVGAARAAKEIMKLDFGWDEVESLQMVQYSILGNNALNCVINLFPKGKLLAPS